LGKRKLFSPAESFHENEKYFAFRFDLLKFRKHRKEHIFLGKGIMMYEQYKKH